MKTIDQLNVKLFQTSLREIAFNQIQIIVKQNKFLAGTVHIEERIFVNASRSPKNLFFLFGSPSLGLSAELLNIVLPHFNINRIIIPYQGADLETTASKWRKLGIVSPFCNRAVDKQIILALDKINLDESEPLKMIIPDNQLSLWSA